MLEPWLDILAKSRAIAVIRAASLTQGLRMAEAVALGGLEIVEVTWNSYQPQELIEQIRRELPHCCLGTGTILSLGQFQQAQASGVEFCFTPHVQPLLIQRALEADIPMIPGALTPTEIVNAWDLGASCVKVFPVSSVGGVAYIKNLQGPLGKIPLIPTGGVTLANACDFIRAGAIAVGLSSQLFPSAWLEEQAWGKITEQARLLKQSLDSLSRKESRTD